MPSGRHENFPSPMKTSFRGRESKEKVILR
jgi:hypothetical protein